MTIKHRLEMGFGLIILVLTFVTGLSAWLTSQAHRAAAHLEDTCLQQMELSRLLIQVNRQMKELGEYVVLCDEDELTEFQAAGRNVSDSFDRWRRSIVDEIGRATSGHEREERRELDVWDDCRGQYLQLMETCQQVVALVQSGADVEAMELQEYRIEVAYDEGLREAIQKQLRDEQGEIDEVRTSTWRFFGLVRKLILVSAAAALVCAVAASRVVTRSIAGPMARLHQAAARIGQGQLDTEIDLPNQDEMGELAATLNQMARDLKNTTVSRDDLRREVAQRQKAERDLEAINEELRQFAYVVSHDLKAPLRGVRLISQYLCEDYADKLGEQGLEQLDLLKGRVGRMYDLIDGVLQYSRIGCVQEDPSEVDLDKLTADVIDMIAPPDHVEIAIDGPLPKIKCDKTRMKQVFQNLISNAIKYMDKPTGQIVVACSSDEGMWTFRVSDNGPGIEEKYFDRIFQIFQTLTSRDRFESTGVGLTVVKKIVESYGGRIWVESELGQGSTFFFTFPKQATDVSEVPVAVGAT